MTSCGGSLFYSACWMYILLMHHLLGASILWFLELTLASKRRTPHEMTWKAGPENVTISCVPLRSLSHFERCASMKTISKLPHRLYGINNYQKIKPACKKCILNAIGVAMLCIHHSREPKTFPDHISFQLSLSFFFHGWVIPLFVIYDCYRKKILECCQIGPQGMENNTTMFV